MTEQIGGFLHKNARLDVWLETARLVQESLSNRFASDVVKHITAKEVSIEDYLDWKLIKKCRLKAESETLRVLAG